MHAERRLALITASNVTKEPKLREPEPGRSYSRKGLFTERWFPDRRLDETFQLPDIFYSKDAGAFDKGHVVRRDDVAWGETFELLLKGNVDSFHVTNCSPQVAGYNRSDSGEDNWGDLENHILSEAASERLCVFAGPVMRKDDPVFVGRGSGGSTIRAHIPTAFWKVVVARVSEGIAAYGFLLDQDLADVPLEFTVPEAFAVKMRPLDEVEALAGVTFAPAIRHADQYRTTRGLEIAYRAGTR
jgi:endonuclease G, mitochondrial